MTPEKQHSYLEVITSMTIDCMMGKITINHYIETLQMTIDQLREQLRDGKTLGESIGDMLEEEES